MGFRRWRGIDRADTGGGAKRRRVQPSMCASDRDKDGQEGAISVSSAVDSESECLSSSPNDKLSKVILEFPTICNSHHSVRIYSTSPSCVFAASS